MNHQPNMKRLVLNAFLHLTRGLRAASSRTRPSAPSPRHPVSPTPRHTVSQTLLTLFTLLTVTLLIGCKRSEAGAKPADVDYYTCTMHPSVKSQDPKAKCPICSMDLVPVKKHLESSHAQHAPDALRSNAG